MEDKINQQLPKSTYIGDYLEIAEGYVSQMTLQEQVDLCSGQDYWTLKAIKRLGIESITMMDGPHGLRKQIGQADNLGIGSSEPAVCYPTASALACSFDKSLLKRVGVALGQACLQEGVSVILGPGVNMKRSPLCGRNFEYFSEDPLVSGKLAAAMIQGVQSTGVGTSLKHFAVNNQEKRRMSVSAVVDDRTLREYYLKAFEIAVKEGKPDTIMCSYNKINGTYASENAYLLKDILREEWGYEGATVSDWGAVHHRPSGVAAGLNLEMPGNDGYNDKKVMAAIEDGSLSKADLRQNAIYVTALILKGMAHQKTAYHYDSIEHHQLAQEAARECGVLLKNEEGLLPLKASQKIGVVGAFAKKPRYQGAGSSKINPIKVDTAWEYFEKSGLEVAYAEGYTTRQLEVSTNNPKDQDLKRQAVEIAKSVDVVCLFAGLTEGYESEGFDRTNLKMPQNQIDLIEAVSKVNPNVVVVLAGGAPFELPWQDKVKAILLSYLSGEGGGKAVVDLLLGEKNPSGKLAETWPMDLESTPAYKDFPGLRQEVLYKESLYVGYRYYDSYDVPVNYPFGYGLSYTTFEYSDFDVIKSDQSIECQYTLTNTGNVYGKETAFIFAEHDHSELFTPKRQLVAFQKTALEAGQSQVVHVSIPLSELSHYHVNENAWKLEGGHYRLCLARDSRQICHRQTIELDGQVMNQWAKKINRVVSHKALKDYYESELITEAHKRHMMFEKLYGAPLRKDNPPVQKPFNEDHTLEDAEHTIMGKLINLYAGKIAKDVTKDEPEQEGMMLSMIKEMPFFAMVSSGDGMLSEEMMYGIIDLLNGHLIRGIKHLM